MLTEPDRKRIIFGCGNFGGIGSSPSLRSAGDSAEQALELLDHARRVGLRRFDTANTYGGGVSEEVLGTWLRAQGAGFRQEVQIATKVGNPHGCPPGETPLSRARSRIISMFRCAGSGSSGSIFIICMSSTG